MTSIKKRATNFSYKEEKTLLALEKKYASTIECKKTDVNSNKLKAASYEKLSVEFNSICSECYRDPKTLRSKYENIKKCGKKKFSDDKAYLRGTGGGPAKDTSSSEIQSELQEILGNQMTGFNSEFDDDRNLTIPGAANVLNTSDSDNNIVLFASNSGTKPIDIILDWSEYSPDMLRTRPSSVLQPVSQQNMFDVSSSRETENMNAEGELMIEGVRIAKTLKDKESIMGAEVDDCNYSNNLSIQKEIKGRARNRPLKDKLTTWATSKTNLLGLQEELMRKEHNLKLELMNARHRNSCEVEKRESDHKIELMSQKHAKEMELLDLKLMASK